MDSLKSKIREHYDIASPYYVELWGNHIHHGFWKTGKESKEKAQQVLIEELADRLYIKKNSKILDVGCGVGGSAFYLANKFKARVTGITISPKQVEIANELKGTNYDNVKFLVMDADNIKLKEKFDLVWSIEAISHFSNKEKFFKDVSRILNKGGKVGIIDWFKSDGISTSDENKFIRPIEKGMLLPCLNTIGDYTSFLINNGLKVLSAEDVSKNVSKTWDISLAIIKDPKIWKIAMKNGKEFISFLQAFKFMKNGFKSKTFTYGIIVAEKV